MTPTTASPSPRYRSTRRSSHDGPARPADRWRVTAPARYAEYLAALETIHRDVFRQAHDWHGVDVGIAAGCRLVVRLGERVASEAIREDALTCSTAMRQQIVALARRLA